MSLGWCDFYGLQVQPPPQVTLHGMKLECGGWSRDQCLPDLMGVCWPYFPWYICCPNHLFAAAIFSNMGKPQGCGLKGLKGHSEITGQQPSPAPGRNLQGHWFPAVSRSPAIHAALAQLHGASAPAAGAHLGWAALAEWHACDLAVPIGAGKGQGSGSRGLGVLYFFAPPQSKWSLNGTKKACVPCFVNVTHTTRQPSEETKRLNVVGGGGDKVRFFRKGS